MDRRCFYYGLLAIVGIVQFLLAVWIAATQFPDGYSLSDNFLSDLGRNRTPHGRSNQISARVFNFSIIALGVMMGPFYTVMPESLSRNERTVRFAGLLSIFGLIGIGLTPYDELLWWHHIALVMWVGPMLLLVIVLYHSLQRDGSTSRILAVTTWLVAAAIIAYALIGNHTGFVIFQKIVTGLSVLWFVVVFGHVAFCTYHLAPSSRRLIAEQQARDYLQSMKERQGRRYIRRK